MGYSRKFICCIYTEQISQLQETLQDNFGKCEIRFQKLNNLLVVNVSLSTIFNLDVHRFHHTDALAGGEMTFKTLKYHY